MVESSLRSVNSVTLLLTNPRPKPAAAVNYVTIKTMPLIESEANCMGEAFNHSLGKILDLDTSTGKGWSKDSPTRIRKGSRTIDHRSRESTSLRRSRGFLKIEYLSEHMAQHRR